MTRNNAFVAQQIAQEGEFAKRVQEKQTALASSSKGPLNRPQKIFDVSSTEVLNNTLILAQLLTHLLKSTASPLPPRNRAATRRIASGKPVGRKGEAFERFAKKTDREKSDEDLGKQSENKPQTKTEEVDFKKIVEEFLKFDPETIERKVREERISKELSQRRQNLPAISQTQIKKFIEEQKASNPNQPVDFSSYSGCKLVGSPFEVMIPGTSSMLNKLENVVSDLDVHNTNFFENINIDGCYFRGGNFSKCRFGDTIGVTFDGSDLTNADMSGTRQTRLLLGGNDYSGSASMLISYVRKNTKDQEVISDDFKSLILRIEDLEKVDIGSESTKFVKVNLQGSTLDRIESRYRTDFEGTGFRDVVLEGIDNFHGKNVDLSGAILKTLDGQIKNITNPITPKQIAIEATPYVAAMLQNNVLKVKDGETIIALSKDCLNKTKQQMLDKGLLTSEYIFLDPTEEDFKKILDLYNREFKKFNVRFTRHKEDEPYDYFISFCHIPEIEGNAIAHGRLDWTNQGKISFDNQTISNPLVQLHEMGHILGAAHPYEVGVKETKCSFLASVMCYDTALDIMVPLDALSKYPARISYEMLENLGIQDKSHYNLIFGKNPDYQEQDITTNLNHGQIRIIDGDKNFQNIAHIDTTSLPKDIRFVVLDAKEAIGTCFKFPCDPQNIAEGIDEGTLVVFYTKNQSGGDEISGAALLFGGKTNSIFIDGKEVVPKRGLIAEPTKLAPTTATNSAPIPTPTPAPPSPSPTSAPPPPSALAPTSAATPTPTPELAPAPASTPTPELAPKSAATPELAPKSAPTPTPTPTPTPELAPKSAATPELAPTSAATPELAPKSAATPELAPKSAPTPTPTPTEISSKSDNNLIGPLLGGAGALLIIMVILAIKNRSRNNNNDTELTEASHAVSSADSVEERDSSAEIGTGRTPFTMHSQLVTIPQSNIR